jgi:hypothetical protein
LKNKDKPDKRKGKIMSSTDITKEDKLGLIASRIRSVKINKYSAELNIIEQNATDAPEATIVASSNKTIDTAEAQIAALQAQYDAVNVE